MSFIETALEGKNEKERKNKAVCAVIIVITAILLIFALLAFTICQIVNAIDDNDGVTDYKIERTEITSLDPKAVHLGPMLTLDADHSYAGGDEDYFVNLQERTDRPKKEDGTTNAYTVYAKADVATDMTASALNRMLTDFYSVIKDDNLIVFSACKTNSNQAPVFSAGTAVEFKYFTADMSKDPIDGVATYTWLYENAHTYGFIALDTDRNIFRYVGVEFATAIKAGNDTFDSFTAKLKAATPENPVFLTADKTKAAYYCSIDNVQVPVNYSYTHYGDNVNGVYVVVDFLSPKTAN